MRRAYLKFPDLWRPWMGVLCSLPLAGCNARMERPAWLWGEACALLLVVIVARASRAQKARLDAFVGPKLQPRLVRGVQKPRRKLKQTLRITAFALGIFSLSGVQYGFAWEEVHRRGVDIVVALDVSDSMLVHDGESHTSLSRLASAKREIIDLLNMLEGDRIALVAFAGAAFVECPLTLDYSAAAMFLEDLDTDLIAVKGTAIDHALTTSMQVLEHSGKNAQAIILITDGEDHSGAALKVAAQAREQGVHVYPIGIGRDEGAPIPLPQGGFHRDAQGNLVLSHLDEPTLKHIAEITKGIYTRSVAGDMDLQTIYRDGIRKSLDAHDLGVRRKQHWQERYQWPLALALLLLAIEALLPETQKTGEVVGV